MAGKHAILSPSSAVRWMHCTRAPRLEALEPETTSTYAEEGRLAHEIAELRVKKNFTPMKPSQFNRALKKLKADPLYQSEMLKHVDTYIDYLNSAAMQYDNKPFVVAEQKVDLSQFVPEGFGRCDCIMIGGGLLRIIDFKYGAGVPVDADHNPQMMLYALGALSLFGSFYPIERVMMTIVQPRLDSISEYEISRDDLLNWGVFEVKPKADIAFKGEGEFAPGEWCRFCRIKGKCRARAEQNTAAYDDFKGARPPMLTDAEVGEALTKAKDMKKWVTDLEDYALKAELDGTDIPGWKAVEGRSNRQISDLDKAFETLHKAGFDDALLYNKKPLGITDLEKLVGKKELTQLCGEYIVKPIGKPTLVADSDKRPQYQPAAADFAGVTQSN